MSPRLWTKIRISRSGFLTALVVVALIAAVPFALLELIRTGESYILSHCFAEDVVVRLHGPGRLRFILQPSLAVLVGVRDGTKDARAEPRAGKPSST